MDSPPKQTSKLRWTLIFAGLGIIFVCLLPGDLIIAHWGKAFKTLQTQAWMHPFTWPLISLGILFILAPFSDKLLKKAPLFSVGTGLLSLLLLYGIEPFIRLQLLQFWLNRPCTGLSVHFTPKLGYLLH
jgi:hypothetical protein